MSRCTRPAWWAAASPPRIGGEHRGDGMRRHRAAFAQQFAQRATLDQLHDQERVLAVEALVVDRDEAGILQSRDRAGLALEPGEELLVARVPRIHDLAGDRPVQPEVESPVHRGHAAGGDQGVDAVAPVQHDADERVRSLAGTHACILDSAR